MLVCKTHIYNVLPFIIPSRTLSAAVHNSLIAILHRTLYLTISVSLAPCWPPALPLLYWHSCAQFAIQSTHFITCQSGITARLTLWTWKRCRRLYVVSLGLFLRGFLHVSIVTVLANVWYKLLSLSLRRQVTNGPLPTYTCRYIYKWHHVLIPDGEESWMACLTLECS